MKLFFIFIIIIAFTAIGYFVFENYKRKKRFYSDIVDFCNYLTNEIRFNKSNISKIIIQSKGRFEPELEGFLHSFIENYTYQPKVLSEIEGEEVVSFLNSLGKFDVDGELKNISRYKELFVKKLATASEQEKTKGAALFKIFIILGLLVSIIII